MDSPILHEAREWLNLPVGWDLAEKDLAFHQVLKKKQLKKFQKEIDRLVKEQKAIAMNMQASLVHNAAVPVTVPAVAAPTAPAVSVPAASLPAAGLAYHV